MTCRRRYRLLFAMWYRPRSLPSWMYAACSLLLLLLVRVAWLEVCATKQAMPLVRQQKLVGEMALLDRNHQVLLAGEAELSYSKQLKITQTADSEMEAESISVSLHLSSHMTTIPTIAWMKKTGNLSTLLMTLDEDNLVLDTDNVRIFPKQLTVSEGHSSRLVCTSMQLLQGNSNLAPYMTFQLPPMSVKDKQSVQLILRPGAAILKIQHVKPGHQGVYTCIMADLKKGKRRFNSMILNVTQRELSHNGKEEEDSKNAIISVGGLDFPAADQKGQWENLKEIRNQDFHRDVDIKQLLARGKFQEQQVEKFCAKYNLSHQANILPRENESSNFFYRHLLVNDKAETLFCFIPKTGCTNLKILFFLVQGYIPLSQLTQARDGVDQDKLELAQFQESFLNRNQHQRHFALTYYFKFMMFRNPLDRLISAYRSKVARYPLSGLKNDTPHYNWLRKAILKQTHPEQYLEFLHQRGKRSINISFTDFVDYWVDLPKEIKFDEHFCMGFFISQPCRVRYNFYGNFKNFEVDSSILIEKIQAKPQFLRQSYYINKVAVSTEALAPKLYTELDTRQKQKLLQVLAQDLEFYYHIFPEEKDIHKSLLGVDSNLPTASIARQSYD